MIYLNDKGLARACRDVIAAQGITQTEVAARLGVQQPSVAQALGGTSGLVRLRLRILSEIGGRQVDPVPHYGVAALDSR